jgi:cytoskeletal protein CcmA (bactofilin family)
VLKQIINQGDDPESNGDAKSGGNPSGGVPATASTPKKSSGPGISAGASKNILSSDVEIRGKLRFSNDLIIDGRIEGEVNSEGDLTVGENAQIVGNIKTRSVVVFGKVDGNITVTDRCELKQNALLHGDVVAGKLAIEEGATFVGLSTVGTPKSGGNKPSQDKNNSGNDQKQG